MGRRKGKRQLRDLHVAILPSHAMYKKIEEESFYKEKHKGKWGTVPKSLHHYNNLLHSTVEVVPCTILKTVDKFIYLFIY